MVFVFNEKSTNNFRIMKKSMKSKVKITEEEKREKIRAAMIKKKDLEKKTLKIVEQLLETGLSESFLIDVSSSLNQNFYADAVEERSLAGKMIRLKEHPLFDVSSCRSLWISFM